MINILSPKTNNMHVVAAYLMYIHNFAKIVRHLGGHLGFLGPHHDSSQSPSIFLHLRYFSNHLWNNFLWTSHAHRHPLRDCIKKTSCKLQIMDSEDEVYVPQTSMEIEYALTINKTQGELKKCMNEKLKLKQTISILEKEKETMQRYFSENADKTKKQVEEIVELRKWLEQLESNSDNFARIRQMISLSKSEAREMDAKGRNESQRQLEARAKITQSTNGLDMAKEQNLIEDVRHSFGETNMRMKQQKLMQNSELSKGDIPSYNERHLYAWSKFLENIENTEY